VGLATLAAGGGALLVLLVYLPALQAPFLVPKFAALEVSASLGVVAFALHRTADGSARWSRGVAAGAWLVLATTAIAWAVASHGALGDPYAMPATARWAALFGLACASRVVDSAAGEARWRVFEAITIATGAVAGIGLLQHIELLPLAIPVISTPGSTFGNRNFAGEAAAVALPFGLAAAARSPRPGSRWPMAACVVLEVLFLGATRARGAWIGAVCGVAVAVWLARSRWSRASVAMAAGAIVVAVLAAAIPGRFNPRDSGDTKRYAGVVEVLQEGLDARSTALRTRLGLWRRTLTMIREHPFAGVGPGNWPVSFPLYAEPGAASDGVLTAARGPRQAHDDLLERTAETGLPGLMALCFLGAGAVVAVRRRLETGDDEVRAVTAASSGALIAVAAISVASFPLEMPGTIALAGIALGFIAGGSERESTRARSTPSAGAVLALRRGAVAGALLLAACAVVRAERNIRGSAWLGVAERALHRDRGDAGGTAALIALKDAADATPADYRVELRTSQMLLRVQRPADSALAARRALAIEPYAPDAWTALAAADLATGDVAGARSDADEALRLLADDPFALDLRGQAAAMAGDAVAADADQSHLRALALHSGDADTTRAARALVGGAY
jgi:O-antigen ligase